MKKEIQLIELKEKVSEAKNKKDQYENVYISAFFGFLTFTGFSIFVYVKKQEIPEKYWGWAFYGCIAFTVFSVIIGILNYNWSQKANRELKELEKQERELKNSIR